MNRSIKIIAAILLIAMVLAAASCAKPPVEDRKSVV